MEALPRQKAVLSDVLIDDVTWRCATRSRRAEWLQAIAELLQDSDFSAESTTPQVSLRGYVLIEAQRIHLAYHDPQGHELGHLQLKRPQIAPVFREYLKILQNLGSSELPEYSPQFEALDIARRLVHDDAAELLQRESAGVYPSHKTARLLFTLLLLLTHDTTKMQATLVWPS